MSPSSHGASARTGRDCSMILDSLRARPSVASTYDWRTRAEPLLWYADTLAGLAREHLTQGQSAGFIRLHRALIVTDIRYVTQGPTGNA